MLAPKINLNGTDGEILRDEYLIAINALGDAANAINRITVHARDYDQMGLLVRKAVTDRTAILVRLDQMIDELRKTYVEIDDQI